jgi:small ligand-binding sensory domain FIST
MKWATSISTLTTVEACIEEVTRTLQKKLGTRPAHLSLLFVSPHFRKDYAKIPQRLRAKMDPGLLIGCSGGGIIGGGQEVEHRPAISMTTAYLPGVDIRPIYTDTANMPDQDRGPSAWREWIGVDAGKSPSFIFLADPFSFHGEEFLAGMDFAYPTAAKVGGLASGANAQGGNTLYLGDKVYDKGCVGFALTGNIQLDTIVAQGCRPIGQPMKITKCRETLLQELEGTPPIRILEELVETLNDYDRQLLQTSLFLGLEMNPFEDHPKQGDFLIRNLIGADRSSGALAIGAHLREGMLVQFHLRDKIMSAEDLELLLTRYRAGNTPDDIQGALLFSCLGRGEHLYGKPNHDSDLFKNKLGEIPLGGFFCNGEIGPVGKTTFLHGYTSSFGIFKEMRTAEKTL